MDIFYVGLVENAYFLKSQRRRINTGRRAQHDTTRLGHINVLVGISETVFHIFFFNFIDYYNKKLFSVFSV